MCKQIARLSYSSVKFVKIKSWKAALLYYVLLVAISCVIGVGIYRNKTYQTFDQLVGSTTLKPKGVATSDLNGVHKTYDSDDLYEPLQNGAMFITTSFIPTDGQTRGQCSSPETGKCNCGEGKTIEECCVKGEIADFRGFKTGKCEPNSDYCQVDAWCPLEVDNNTTQILLNGIEDWGIFARVNVIFEKFNVLRTNADVRPNLDDKKSRGYNMFTISDILNQTGYEYDDKLQVKGAVILGTVQYDCNFDDDVSECNPEFTFVRIDKSHTQELVSKGFNYRKVTKYQDNNVEYRNLEKLNGIQLIWHVYGEAGKFDPFALLQAIGAGVALLGVSNLIVDMLLQYLVNDPKAIQKHRVDYYNDNRDDDILNNYGAISESVQNNSE